MFCAYHPSNAARVQCAACARALCPACDHRIKGYPYCQDCIVLGIETLSRQYYHKTRPRSRARLAAVCALIPGLGAVFNRQNAKAVVHFITVVGLFEMSDLGVFAGMFAMAGFVFYLYSIIDAYRTAQAIAEGESPAADEERFKRRLAQRAPVIGLALILGGLLLFVRLVNPFGLTVTMTQLLPVAFILLGGYLLTRYLKRGREPEAPPVVRPPYNLIPGNFAGRHETRKPFSRSGDFR